MKDMDLYYDRQGKVITREQWGELIHTGLDPDGHYGANSYKRIGERDFDGGITVSTVWLGIDHGFTDDTAPVIFETMVFGGDWGDAPMMRYCTEAEAIEGHAKTCADIEAGRPLWFDAEDLD